MDYIFIIFLIILIILLLLFLISDKYKFEDENEKFINSNKMYLYNQLNNNSQIFKYLSLVKVKNPLKCCIILTMYIGNDRRYIYEDIAKKWLDNTDFTIFSVDSSGQYLNIKNPRLFQYSFIQKKINNIDKYLFLTSLYERDSLLYIFEYYKNKIKNFDMIFKVTGKYFTKELENLINYIPTDAEVILQNQDFTWNQNSELVGLRNNIFLNVINNINARFTFEQVLYNILFYKIYNTYKLPPLKIENNIKRGDNIILKYL